MKYPIAALCSLMAFMPAHAASEGGMWVGPVAMLCLLQDDSNEKTAIGKRLVELPDYQQMRAQGGAALKSCMVRKHPIPNSLCKELLSKPDASPAELNAMYEKHADAISGMTTAARCDGQ